MFIFDLKSNPPFSFSEHDSRTFSLIIKCDDSHAMMRGLWQLNILQMNLITSTMLIIKLLMNFHLLFIGYENLPLVLMLAKCG